jgi:NAD(P)-dependent dehydrogenase (short-subunit alcohol dehydrogenase family)
MHERIAVVTGAARGIGRATAARLLEDGHRVVGTGRSRDGLEAARRSFGEGARFEPRVVDVRDGKGMAECFRSLERVDIVVANAGIVRQALLTDAEADEIWREVLSTNLDGVFNTLRGAEPFLRDGGRVVIVSSGLGKLGRAAFGAYAAAKHGVLGLMKCVAKELSARKISVNAVCPGWVDTGMARSDLARFARESARPVEDVEAEIVRGIPLGRLVRPEEVADLIRWLTSEGASAVTGEAFNISGGEFFA